MFSGLRSWLLVSLLVVLLFLSNMGRFSDSALSLQFLPNERYFEVLQKHLATAQKEIVMSMYLFVSTDKPYNRPAAIEHALITAAQRGVSVSVLLERAEEEEDAQLNQAHRLLASRLQKKGIAVVFDTLKQRTHTKLIVIDRRYVFLGSHNLTHSALKYNNEASVLIDSPRLAQTVLDYIATIRQSAS